jgi:hypothetical protein
MRRAIEFVIRQSTQDILGCTQKGVVVRIEMPISFCKHPHPGRNAVACFFRRFIRKHGGTDVALACGRPREDLLFKEG